MCTYYKGLHKKCEKNTYIETLSESFNCKKYKYKKYDERTNNNP